MPSLCRDCLTQFDTGARCPKCRSPRLLAHPELNQLSIAHMDCDAFYASVEKRDNPELRDKAVIIGNGKRGVVSTCCYIARTYGVRSAMPIFKARALCPDAVFVPPNMAKYARVGREVRQLMLEHAALAAPAGAGHVVQRVALLQRHQTLCGRPGRRWTVQCSSGSGHPVGYRGGFLACALQPLPERAGRHVELAGNADNGTRAAMPGFEQCLLFEFGRVM